MNTLLPISITIVLTQLVTIATLFVAKTPFISALGVMIQIQHGEIVLCYQHLISMIRRNFWQSL